MTTPQPPDGPGEHPVRPDDERRAQAGPGDRGDDQPTARFAQPPADRGSRWTTRRRWLAAGAGVLLVAVVGAALFGVARNRDYDGRWGGGHLSGGHWSGGHWSGGHWSGGHSPDRVALPDGFDEDSLMLGGGRMGPGQPAMGPGGMGPGGFGGEGPGRHGGPRALANTAAITGSVVSVAPDNLVIAADGAGQITIPTDDRTRVRGAGNGLTGLQPGQRVVVRVGGDRSAVAVLVPVARAAGTITVLDGDRATLVRPGGLTEVVDIAAINPKPAAGDVVTVSGTPAENGGVLKADQLRVLPKAS
ncbi:MAG: hypothetical protein ACT4O0_16285 [Pseudonocardia sp.]